MANGRDDRPLEGGGHPVDRTGGDREKAQSAGKAVTPAKSYTVVIWIFVILLLVAIVIALVGALSS